LCTSDGIAWQQQEQPDRADDHDDEGARAGGQTGEDAVATLDHAAEAAGESGGDCWMGVCCGKYRPPWLTLVRVTRALTGVTGSGGVTCGDRIAQLDSPRLAELVPPRNGIRR